MCGARSRSTASTARRDAAWGEVSTPLSRGWDGSARLRGAQHDYTEPATRHMKRHARLGCPCSGGKAAVRKNAQLVLSRAGAGRLSALGVCGGAANLVPCPQAADRHQDANAGAAAAVGAALIVWQHPPEHPALAQAIWRLLGPRLRGCDPAADPLRKLRSGMERLAVRDADQLLAQLLLELSG